jgi:hypothetical protein
LVEVPVILLVILAVATLAGIMFELYLRWLIKRAEQRASESLRQARAAVWAEVQFVQGDRGQGMSTLDLKEGRP